MKLHLGCGQNHLTGYVNIDYPASTKELMTKQVADIEADISTLRYRSSSIEEIRLHHVFEHFPRPIACALLVGWRKWLKPNGILHIEVPDFNKMALMVLNPLTSEERKLQALRHIFGSHEGFWAVHQDGWSCDRIRKLFTVCGYEVKSSKPTENGMLKNVDIIGVKRTNRLVKTDRLLIKEYLSQYLISKRREQGLLNFWMTEFDRQLKKMNQD